MSSGLNVGMWHVQALGVAFFLAIALPATATGPELGPSKKPCEIFDVELMQGKYVGSCINGQAHDNDAKVFDAQGQLMYQGVFQGGRKNGRGKKIYSNGDVYIGMWKDDQRSGYGTYTYGLGSPWHGDSYTGLWTADKMDGLGTYRWVNGEVFSGIWRLNQISDGRTPGQAMRAAYAAKFFPELEKTQGHVCAASWHPDPVFVSARGRVSQRVDDRILVQLSSPERALWQLVSHWRPCAAPAQ